MSSKRYAVCVTTFTLHVHLHGAFFVSFLLLTGRCYDAETSVILLLLDRAIVWYAFCKVWKGQCRVFSRDILKGGNIGVRAGGRGVLGAYYLLENIITANLKGGKTADSLPSPPLESTLHTCTWFSQLYYSQAPV